LFVVTFCSAIQLRAEIPQGDVNGDGVINPVDPLMIKDHLMERTPLTGDPLTRADANGDGSVTMADVVWVASHLSQVTVALPGGVPLVMVRIPAGSFQMGRYAGERHSYSDEDPQHPVTIGYDFYLGKYELTQQQWLALMGSWPGNAPFSPSSTYGVGNNYPAYYISWSDCQNFITALNSHISSTSQGPANFRLPSEAEWEYACRAGTQTRFFFGDSLSVDDSATDGPAGTLPGNRSDYMWFGENNSPYGTKPVGTKLPNQFGLYDMSGNVWEWCQDYRHSNYNGAPANGSAWLSPTSSSRVARGGYWYSYAGSCRSAGRDYFTPGYNPYNFGGRLAWTH